MTAFKKIAITVPVDTYRALEKARSQLGKTRSDAISIAIRDWLRGLDADAQRQRYVQGYLKRPEQPTPGDDALLAAATSDWAAWSPGEPSRASEPRRRKR